MASVGRCLTGWGHSRKLSPVATAARTLLKMSVWLSFFRGLLSILLVEFRLPACPESSFRISATAGCLPSFCCSV